MIEEPEEENSKRASSFLDSDGGNIPPFENVFTKVSSGFPLSEQDSPETATIQEFRRIPNLLRWLGGSRPRISVAVGIFAGLIVAMGFLAFDLKQEDWTLRQKYPNATNLQERYFFQARDLVQQGEYSKALPILRKLVEERSYQGLRGEALLLLGKSLEASSSDLSAMAEARNNFAEFIQEYPSDPRVPSVHMMIAENLARVGCFDDSNARYDRLLRMTSDVEERGRIEFLIAQNQYRAGALRAAIEAMEQIQQRYPGSTVALDSMLARAQALASMERDDEARLVAFDLAGEAPGTAQAAAALHLLAKISLANGDYDDAMSYCARWFKESPLMDDHVDVMLTLSLAKLRAGFPKEALAIAFDVATLTAEPGRLAEASILRGEAMETMGDIEGAEKAYTEAARLAPEQYKADEFLSRVYQANKNLPKAIEHMKLACSKAPLNDALPLELARLYRQNNQEAEALDLLQRFTRDCQLSIHIAEASFMLADIQIETDHLQDAYTTLERLLGTGTTTIEDDIVLEKQADILARMGLYDDAIQAYQGAREARPNSAVIGVKIARTFLAKGEPQECLDEAASVKSVDLTKEERLDLILTKAKAYLALNSFIEARRSAQSALALGTGGEYFSVLALLMQANLGLQDDRGAFEIYSRTTKLLEDVDNEAPPNARRIVLDWARRLYETGNYEQAARTYAGIQSPRFPSPDVAWALYQQGNCYYHDTDFEKANTLYARLATEFADSEWVKFAKQRQELMSLRSGT